MANLLKIVQSNMQQSEKPDDYQGFCDAELIDANF